MARDLADLRDEPASVTENKLVSWKAILLLIVFLLGFAAGAFLMQAFIEPGILGNGNELKQCLDSKKILDLQLQDSIARLDACIKEDINAPPSE